MWSRFVAALSGLTMAKELQRANEDLVRQYQQLEKSNQLAVDQAQRLGASLAIAQAAQGKLDLDQTLLGVTRVLVECLKIEGAEINVDAKLGELSVKERATCGALGADPMRFFLNLRGEASAELRVGVDTRARHDQVRTSVTDILPNISMALNHALAFTALADSRVMLEKRVQLRSAALAAALEDVQLQQQTRERIFQNISHELRTPLSLISLSSDDVLKRDKSKLSDVSIRRLSDIEESTARVLHLFDGMLLLAAGNEGRLRLQPVEVDIADFVKRLVLAWQLPAEKSGISVSYHGPSTLMVRADVRAIERVLSNLMSNALKFTHSGGTVIVSLGETSVDTYSIEVKDSGVGMDPEFLSRVFGRFEQGPSPVRSGERGSGIGLAIVKEIVAEHQGTVSVRSVLGEGSVFSVSLPRHLRVEEPARAGGSNFPDLAIPGHPQFNDDSIGPYIGEEDPNRRFTVLVAEDDPGLRRLLIELLQNEYRVIAAADGKQALQLAREFQPALLMSDVEMPNMNGFELTEEFRKIVNDKLAPVILVTAYSLTQSRRRGLEAGAIDYITKPFDAEELLARIRNHLKLRELAMQLHESQKLAGLGTLSAGLAHEFRNPANGVVNALPLLKKILPQGLLAQGHPASALLGAMELGAGQIASLSRQLLGLSRPGELELEWVSVTRLVDSAWGLVAPAAAGRNLRQELAYVGEVQCARVLLIQVLTNLLENAVHASAPQGEVVLKTSRLENRVLFEVCDFGPGVPQALRNRIFDPFFTTKPEGQGTGLGLSVSRMIVERHGGTLTYVDSAEGAIFRIELRLPSHI